MFTNLCRSHLRTVGQCIRVQARRNIGCSAVLAQTAEDPIQKLFVQKIREYAEKKKSSGGKMDLPADSQKELKNELSRIETQFQASGVDMTKFPTFNFKDQPLEVPAAPEKTAESLPL